jgi:putative CocE/NonD family hydrolase
MECNNHQAQPRGYVGAGFDRLVSWMIGYPPERCSFTTQALRIPVSDGLTRIELAADLYQPLRHDGAKPLGTVLVRSPYGRSIPIALTARPYAARGYQVLLVSSRGTFGSGGDFDPFRTEAQDGKAVVEWMRKQSWYTGTFATVGGSYLGYVQWALLVDPPKDLVAAVPGVSPHDFSRCIWESGAFNLDILRWADMVAKQEQPFSLWDTLGLFGTRKLDSALSGIPLAQAVQTHQGGKTPWLDTMLAKPDMSDPFYAPMQHGAALERSNIPILIITGWYDLFLEQSIEQYVRLKERGCNVSLTVGPWAHFKSGTAKQMSRHGFDWIEEHLAGSSEAKRSVAVQYFVTGADEWRSEATFPPKTHSCEFHLHGGGRLLEQPPSTTVTSSTFTFDPRQPTPTIGGNGLSLGSGICDDIPLAKRSDVLVFDTAPLEGDLEFCGKPTIKLAHSSSSAFADIFVRVSEVDKNGKSHNITEGFKRLDTERDDSADLKLALNHCAHRFLEGKRIRLLVAGGNFPQYARNHGVENLDNTGSEMRAVKHTIHHDAVRMSKVVFPVRSFRPR